MKTRILHAAIFLTLLTGAGPAAEPECKTVLGTAPGEAAEKLAADIPPSDGCPTAEERAQLEARNGYLSLFPAGSPQLRETVNGLTLEGSAEELRIARKLLGSKPPQKWADNAKDCKTVLCGMTRLYGSEEAAQRALTIANRNGYFITASQDHSPAGVEQVWSTAEVRVLDDTMQALPADMNRIKGMENFYRVPDGYRVAGKENAAAFARERSRYNPSTGVFTSFTRTIVFHETAFGTVTDGTVTFHAPSARRTAAHELCHQLDNDSKKKYGELELSQREEFRKLSGWERSLDSGNTAVWKHADKAVFLRPYSGTSPAEDFADSCSYFFLHGDQLQSLHPEKYAFLKDKVFGGKEFLPPPFSPKKWEPVSKKLSAPGFCPDFLANACIARFELDPEQPAYLREKSAPLPREGGGSTWTVTTSSRDSRWENSECLGGIRAALATRFTAELKSEAGFCGPGGGANGIRERLQDACKAEFFAMLEKKLKEKTPPQ